MDAHETYLDNLGNCSDDGFDEVEIELDEAEAQIVQVTACEWVRAGAKILGFPNGEVR